MTKDIVDRLLGPDTYGYQSQLACEAAEHIRALRELLATARADIETAYARGYADATKSIAAVQIRSHG